jgi:hypothetical protein
MTELRNSGRIRLSTRSAPVDRCGCPVEEIDCEREDFLAQEASALTQKQIFIVIGSCAPSGSKKQRNSNHERTTALRQNRIFGQLRFLDSTADLALQFPR